MIVLVCLVICKLHERIKINLYNLMYQKVLCGTFVKLINLTSISNMQDNTASVVCVSQVIILLVQMGIKKL